MSLVDSSFASPLFSLAIPYGAGTLLDVAWSASGTHLAAVTSAGWIFLWDGQIGEIRQQKQVARTALLSITWAREDTALAVGGQDGIVRLLDAQLRISSTYPFEAPVTRIAWAPHVVGACAIVTGEQVTVLREDTRTTRMLHYRSAVVDVAWSGDGRQFAILCADGLVEIWYARQGRLVRKMMTEPLTDGSLSWDQPCRTLLIRDVWGAVCAYPLHEVPEHASPSVSRRPWPKSTGAEREVQDPSGHYLATLHPYAVVLSTLLVPSAHPSR
jgi:WD40 repeat protein